MTNIFGNKSLHTIDTCASSAFLQHRKCLYSNHKGAPPLRYRPGGTVLKHLLVPLNEGIEENVVTNMERGILEGVVEEGTPEGWRRQKELTVF